VISKGVLVAVSIPIFTAQLEKSRESTDMANLRAAKAAAVSEYLVVDSGDTTVTWTDANDASKGFTAYYEAKGGLLQATKPTATYGAGTATVGSASNTDFNYDPAVSVKDKVIKITVDDKGGCTFAWE
jgi:type IV pilus assembly protein PilA